MFFIRDINNQWKRKRSPFNKKLKKKLANIGKATKHAMLDPKRVSIFLWLGVSKYKKVIKIRVIAM